GPWPAVSIPEGHRPATRRPSQRRGLCAGGPRSSPVFLERKEGAAAPHARRIFGKGKLGELVIDRAGQLGLEPMADEDAGRGAVFGALNAQRMLGSQDHRIAAIEPERDAAIAAFAFAVHLDRSERGAFDLDVEL